MPFAGREPLCVVLVCRWAKSIVPRDLEPSRWEKSEDVSFRDFLKVLTLVEFAYYITRPAKELKILILKALHTWTSRDIRTTSTTGPQ